LLLKHSRKLKEAFQNILEKTVFPDILAEGAGVGCPIPPLTHRPVINVRLSANAQLKGSGWGGGSGRRGGRSGTMEKANVKTRFFE